MQSRSVVLAAIMLMGTTVSAAAQAEPTEPTEPPIMVGEELVYRAKSARFGSFGHASMRVDSTEQLRGHETLVLSFDFHGKVLLFKATDRTRSWLDIGAMASLRYTKRERSPISKKDEAVDVFPEQGRWVDTDGMVGELESDAPLDELSYLYYIRTLPLEEGATYQADRHYDAKKNPVEVVVVGRGSLEVGAGTYETIIVEMRVKDEGRYGGSGIVRMHLSADARRVPVRIETSMPVAGKVVLDLEARLVHPAQIG